MTPVKGEETESGFEADDFMPSEEKCFEILKELRWDDGAFINFVKLIV